MAMRKHKPLAMHFVKHRNRLTEYSVVADIQRYRTRAMLARRVLMYDVETAQSQRLLPELSSIKHRMHNLHLRFLFPNSPPNVFVGSCCGCLILIMSSMLLIENEIASGTARISYYSILCVLFTIF